MRSVLAVFALTALLLSFPAAPAAPAPPVDEKAEAEARLDAVLREWAKASDAVQEAHFTVRVTDFDQTTEVKRSSTLEVFVKKPDLMRDAEPDHDWLRKAVGGVDKPTKP
jgi:hypothetical protein